MNQDLVEQIIASGSAVLTDLAHTLGSTGSHIFEVLVRQQSISAITNILALIIFVLYAIALGFLIDKLFDVDDKNKGELSVDFYILMFFGGLLICWIITSNLKIIFNPEYYAIREILQAVK